MTLGPGIHFNIPADVYFADPCERPSLTQSIAKIIVDRSPLHAWHAHPRLNPDYKSDDDTKFDVGNVAHAMMIGRGKKVVAIDFPDWRTNAAKEARAKAAEQGVIAVLGKHYALASRMVDAAREQLAIRGLEHLFRDGNGEVVLAAQEDDIWLRQMVDWLTPDLRTFVDMKTTDMSVAPHALPRMMANAGWHVQAAMSERLLDVLDPEGAGRRRFLFVAQETEPPYCLNVAEITEGALTIGRKQIDHAVEIWRACMRSGRWPGYPLEVLTPTLPGYYESAWLEREIEHDERRREIAPADILAAG